MLNLKVPTQSLFLDRQAVMELLDDATIGPMNRIGGFIRQTARNSMRRKKYPATAPAGEPPYAHAGALKTRMAYAYDPNRGTLIAGPMAINRPSDAGGYTVPQLMEFGGSFVTRETRMMFIHDDSMNDNDGPKGKKKSKKKERLVLIPKGEELVYPPHPFMGPALSKALETDKLRKAWKTVGRGNAKLVN